MLQIGIAYLCLSILIVIGSQVVKYFKMRRSAEKIDLTGGAYGWTSFWPNHGALVALITNKLPFGLLIFVTSGLFWIDLLSTTGFRIGPVSQDAVVPLAVITAGNYTLSVFSAIRRGSFEWYVVTILAVLWTAAITLVIISIDAGVCADVSNCPVKRG